MTLELQEAIADTEKQIEHEKHFLDVKHLELVLEAARKQLAAEQAEGVMSVEEFLTDWMIKNHAFYEQYRINSLCEAIKQRDQQLLASRAAQGWQPEKEKVFEAAYNVVLAGTYGRNMPFTSEEAMAQLYQAVSIYQSTLIAQEPPASE